MPIRRFRSLTLAAAAAAAALPLLAQPVPLSADDATTLRVGFSDVRRLAPSGAAMKEEVERLLAGAGVTIEWTDRISRAHRAEAHDVLIAVTGSSPEGPGWRIEPQAMGAYLVSGGSSAVYVFGPRVSEALGLPPAGQRLLMPRERRELARALGRVAVHELVHRLAPTLPHAESGLMRSRLDRRGLTEKELSLDPATRVALGRSLESASSDEAGARASNRR